MDFKPLYHCIYIYEALGQKPELQRSYQEDRKVKFMTRIFIFAAYTDSDTSDSHSDFSIIYDSFDACQHPSSFDAGASGLFHHRSPCA